jgi:hypothetical protein
VGPLCVTPPEQSEPSIIQPGPNDGQQGAPGRALPESIDVKVMDSDDRPVSGVAVNFSVLRGTILRWSSPPRQSSRNQPELCS